MNVYNLIFSDKWGPRIERHLIFWMMYYIYQVVRMSFLFPPSQLWNSAADILIPALIGGLVSISFATYTTAYYLVPKYFARHQYFLFSMGILMLLILLGGYQFSSALLTKKFVHAIGTTKQQPYIFLRGSIIRLIGNAPLVCGLFISLKALKSWHIRELENQQLTTEKANAELQLLKAQIHPHFLFNTLNNIYSFSLTKSPLAAELVQKLSDMLSYMITDCDRLLVPVEKEIQLIEDYIGLEKVRYGDRLDVQMYVNGDCKNCMIAPLLMIPFVENCFKHGASRMRGKQWMHLVIDVNQNDLDLNLSNSKPPHANASGHKKGIGLPNVQKRLNLLYPGKHQLKIDATENTFSIFLKLTLIKERTVNHEKSSINIPIETALNQGICH